MQDTVEKLASLESAPKTVWDWYDRHGPETQEAIRNALSSPYATKAQVYRVLRADEDNPLTFGQSAFNSWAEEVINDQHRR